MEKEERSGRDGGADDEELPSDWNQTGILRNGLARMGDQRTGNPSRGFDSSLAPHRARQRKSGLEIRDSSDRRYIMRELFSAGR